MSQKIAMFRQQLSYAITGIQRANSCMLTKRVLDALEQEYEKLFPRHIYDVPAGKTWYELVDQYCEQDRDKCPICSAKMRKISGKFGEFYGCISYPRCHGTRKANGDVGANEAIRTFIAEKQAEEQREQNEVGRFGHIEIE